MENRTATLENNWAVSYEIKRIITRLLLLLLSRFSRVWLFVTLWTVARHVPLSMRFSRQGYWGGLPCLPPGNLPEPRIEPESLTTPALAGGFLTTSATSAHIAWEPLWGLLLKTISETFSYLHLSPRKTLFLWRADITTFSPQNWFALRCRGFFPEGTGYSLG